MKTTGIVQTPPEVGATLQKMRLARGLTLDDLSRAAGVSKSMLSQIEREKANPTIAVAWRLANALGVSIAELLSTEIRELEAIHVLEAHEQPTLPGDHAGYLLRILGINGGLNGLAQRQVFYARACRALGVTASSSSS